MTGKLILGLILAGIVTLFLPIDCGGMLIKLFFAPAVVLLWVSRLVYMQFFASEQEKKEAEEKAKGFSEKVQKRLNKGLDQIEKAIEELEASGLVVVTGSTIPGKDITKTFGIISGSSSHFGHDTRSAMLHFSAESAERQAMLHLMQKALAKGANAVVDVKMSTTDLGEESSTTRVTYSGTAVQVA